MFSRDPSKVLVAFALSTAVYSALNQPIPIRTDVSWSKAARPASAAEWMNEAPPFAAYQNDPKIDARYFQPNGATNLCTPTAMANALIYEKWFKEVPVRELSLAGTAGNTIESGVLINDLAARAQANPKADYFHALQALRGIYDQAGLAHAEITLIQRLGGRTTPPEFAYENRTPTLGDITTALQNGYEVIAMLKFANSSNPGKSLGGHDINVWGYGKDSGGNTTLYVTDPTWAYFHYSVPYDFTKAIYTEAPIGTSGEFIEVHGLRARPGMNLTQIKGLMIFKAK